MGFWESSASSDVARPQNNNTKTTYFFKIKTGQIKTKATFSRPTPRPLFLKTIKLLTKDHGRSQKFWLGGAQIGKKFVTLFWWRVTNIED